MRTLGAEDEHSRCDITAVSPVLVTVGWSRLMQRERNDIFLFLY